MDKREIRDTINQLVEAWHDENSAREQLDSYRATYSPPPTPGRFESLQDFLDFHESRQRYEERLRTHQQALDAAREAYAHAAGTLQEVLPEGVPLQYTYQGGRQDREGWRYAIVHRRGDVEVLGSSGPAESSPL